MKIIHEDCDPSLADDKSLPTSSFLVEYVIGKDIHFDIVMAAKQVDIFDHYWDNYRSDLKGMTQAEGRANPKLYNPPKK